MVLCGTKNGSSMASLEEPFEAPLFLRVYCFKLTYMSHWNNWFWLVGQTLHFGWEWKSGWQSLFDVDLTLDFGYTT